MKLKQLLRDLEGVEVRGSKEVNISGLSSDSNTVAPGNLFIAKRGEQYDGAQFIGRAVDAGASAILTDCYDPFLKQTQIIHPAPGKLEALFAARYYGKPSESLFVVGVTGTKGKTTTTYLIRHLLEGLGESTGLIGTVETIIQDRKFPSKLTTHEAISNQKYLREMVDQKCKGVVLEVSSHGLEQGRVDEISFDLAVFTNLYPDHLDYHKTMENYALAKAKLFENFRGTAILNADSPWAASMRGGKKRVLFGIDQPVEIQAREIAISSQGTEFRVRGTLFQTPLLGRFNVYNVLAAIAVGLEKGASLEKIAEILRTFPSVPGRLEPVSNQKGINVFVDYAHTGEALEGTLTALKEVGFGRIFLVFGCGGNRDPQRRKAMGAAAEKGAYQSILTTDNPRGENPEEIAAEVLSGFSRPQEVLLEPDRKKAIALAIGKASLGDCVLIAGKGHEKMQIFAHQSIPFDDVAVAKEALEI